MAQPTKKQRNFVHCYLAQTEKDGQEAAIEAGYAPTSAKVAACRMLNKPGWVRDEIERRQKVLAKEHCVTESLVIEGLLKEAQREGEGSSHAARVSAWEKLGRNLGMFDKVEPVPPPALPPVNVTNNVKIDNVEVRVGEVKEDLEAIFDGAIAGKAAQDPKPIN